MLYPVHIRKDLNGTCRATFPDFNSCFSNIEDRDYLSVTFRKTVETYVRKNGFLPNPHPRIQDLLTDFNFQGGYWMLMDVGIDIRPGKSPKQRKSLPRKLIIIDTRGQ
jgi:hypothetical protein